MEDAHPKRCSPTVKLSICGCVIEIAERYTFRVWYAFPELNSKVRNSRTEAISAQTRLIFFKTPAGPFPPS